MDAPGGWAAVPLTRRQDLPYDLTRAQRCVLADCTRVSLVGWLVTDLAVDRKAWRLEYKATGILGFGFSRFVAMAMTEFGAGYRP